MPAVGLSLRIDGTAACMSPRIALSQCRFADGFSISASRKNTKRSFATAGRSAD
jgi:hypothetical protein